MTVPVVVSEEKILAFPFSSDVPASRLGVEKSQGSPARHLNSSFALDLV
jgi:hypothetical protein